MKEAIKILADLVTYDPISGVFFWKFRPSKTRYDKVFNTRFAGKIAGSKCEYILISYKRRPQLAHQIAWFITYGPIPNGIEIDHINGVKTDNRIENLRLADTKINARNRPIRVDNKSGFQGVYPTKFGTWYAQACVDGRNQHLGTFKTYEEAVAARLVSQSAIGFHPNHGRKAS